MTELQKEIMTAFGIINDIAVTGEDQDRAVIAKEHLRTAYRMAAPAMPEERPEDGREEAPNG